MHYVDTFALDVVRKRYLRPGTENMGSPEFSKLLELYKDRVYDADIASATKTTARQRFGGALRRNDRDRDYGGGGSRENFKTTRPCGGARRPARSIRRVSACPAHHEDTYTYFIADAEAKAPCGELIRDCTEPTRVRYLAWIAERGTIGAGSLQVGLSAINTFIRHTGRDDAPATGDMKQALQIRQLEIGEELRCAPLPCDVITDILDDLATTLTPMTTPGYGTILRACAAVD
eukprot:jgi/Tetstr1/425451/TSEL_015898.t1